VLRGAARQISETASATTAPAFARHASGNARAPTQAFRSARGHIRLPLGMASITVPFRRVCICAGARGLDRKAWRIETGA